MSESIKNLGYYGLVPFVAALLMMVMQQSLYGLNGIDMFITYSAIILSFLTGIWWGIRLVRPEVGLVWILVSNAIAVLAWIALLVSQTLFALAILALGYLTVWFGDSRLNSSGLIRRSYFNFRTLLSTVVIILHAIAASLVYSTGVSV